MSFGEHPPFLAFLANSPPHQTPGQLHQFWAWGIFLPLNSLLPLQPYQGLLAHPLVLGNLGINGLFGPFTPPTTSMSHGPLDLLGLFWPNPRGPPGPISLAKSFKRPKNPRRAINGHRLQDTSNGLGKLPEATTLLTAGFPLNTTKTLILPIMDARMQEPVLGHTWYQIPLFTISSQPSTGDFLKSSLLHFTSFHQSFIKFQKGRLKSLKLEIKVGIHKTIQGP
ncbi:hypothetical protein O181_009070 [Austropuccinia psidii MF-1]|uniref:Uncharacterized protein n=1 Tax=Austropuccinia psidii MF-1 TaxID=1389203 RepID=A0A9Q3BQK7_9BASI|nr:hypothetical protein [Austropuccinia psidii MF-1]